MFLISFDLSSITGDDLKHSIESALEPILNYHMMADKIASRTYMTRSNDNINTPKSIAALVLDEFVQHFDQDGINMLHILKSIKLTVCRIQQDPDGQPIILTDNDMQDVFSELKDYL